MRIDPDAASNVCEDGPGTLKIIWCGHLETVLVSKHNGGLHPLRLKQTSFVREVAGCVFETLAKGCNPKSLGSLDHSKRVSVNSSFHPVARNLLDGVSWVHRRYDTLRKFKRLVNPLKNLFGGKGTCSIVNQN